MRRKLGKRLCSLLVTMSIVISLILGVTPGLGMTVYAYAEYVDVDDSCRDGGSASENPEGTFVAVPNPGWQFDHWNYYWGEGVGSGSSTDNPLELDYYYYLEVVAYFVPASVQTYTVTYSVVNGTWADGTTADKTETVASGASPASIPTGMIPSSGYTGGAWDTDPSGATITGNTTYTYTFVDAPSAAISPENSGTVSVTFDSVSNNWIFTASPAEGYVFDEWNFIDDGDPNNDESNPLSVNRSTFRNWSNLTAVFEEAPAQTYTVTYSVVNGTWSDGTTADKTETVQSGSAPASVPTGMIAASGYTGGSWDTDPSSATITGNITFTYTFEAESVDPDPVTPDPEPVTPSDTPAPVITPEQIQRMAVEHFVERLYVEALGRQFDKNGRDAWADILMAGGSASAVARGFFGSREFLNRDLTNEEFVTILYKVFYDSVPQTGSYTNWVDALYNDTMTRSELIDNFISSYEWSSFCARYGVNV